MSFTRICTPAFGTFTLYQPGWKRPTCGLLGCCPSVSNQYAFESSKSGFAACDGIVVAWLFLCTVIDVVGLIENVESYDRIRLRNRCPSYEWKNVGCASTGRSSPSPGWSP